jgi:hypothetical protein
MRAVDFEDLEEECHPRMKCGSQIPENALCKIFAFGVLAGRRL